MSRKLSGSIELTKLVNIRMKTKEGTLGTFIPDELNHLDIVKNEETKTDRAFISVDIWINDEENEHGQIGSIKQKFTSKKYKTLVKDESTDIANEKSKESPYLGNLKDFSGGSNENTGAAAEGTFDENADDLPF